MSIIRKKTLRGLVGHIVIHQTCETVVMNIGTSALDTTRVYTYYDSFAANAIPSQ
jgi:hypothetical protein